MNLSWIAQYWIDFQKTTFDNTHTAMSMLQDHVEKMSNTLFDQITWLPEESKRLITQWIDIYKKGQDELKAAVDEHFNKVKDLIV